MRLNPTPIAVAALLGAVASNAMSAGSGWQRVGQFDFGYQVSGDFRARPVQVFDDGVGKTYFQFRAGEPIPVVLVGDGQRILFPRAEGPYYVVEGIAREYTLAMGMSRGRAVHTAVLSGVVKPQETSAPASPAADHDRVLLASAAPGLPAGALPRVSYAQPSPESRRDWTQNSYAQPLRGDALQWQNEQPREATVAFAVGESKLSQRQVRALTALGQSAGTLTRVEIVGTDDDSMRERLPETRAEAIRDVLLRAGVPQHNISIVSARAPGVTHGSGKSKMVESVVRWYPARPMAVPAQPAPAQVAGGQAGAISPDTAAMLVKRGLITPEQAAKLVAAPGAGAGATALPVAANGKRESTQFDLRRADVNMSAAITRWGQAAGFEVVWDTKVDAPITGEALVEAANFKAAVAKVTEGLQQAGYPIKARLYSDQVVRFYSTE